MLQLLRRHKWKVVAVYVGSTGLAYAVASSRRSPPPVVGGVCARDPAAAELDGAPSQHAAHSGGQSTRVFDQMAGTYDDEIGLDELVMGLPLLRRALMHNARGRVLEVSCGTGRNLKYLVPSESVAEVTATDVSSVMVARASSKATAAGLKGRKPLVFRAMDSTQLAFRDGSFDTVVDTFGLCSVERPVAALREMARVCAPAEDGGRVLLLEHGRSPYAWLTRILDKHAPRHAARWGCWWNRDIERVIKEAGLEVETHRRFHFGTCHYVVAKPATPTTEGSAEA